MQQPKIVLKIYPAKFLIIHDENISVGVNKFYGKFFAFFLLFTVINKVFQLCVW